jgi:hypothetical protein
MGYHWMLDVVPETLYFNETNETFPIIYAARRCSCAPPENDDFYCRFDFALCSVPSDGSEATCLPLYGSFSENIWPLAFFFFAVLFLGLFFSPRGKRARAYCKRKLRYCGNPEGSERALNQELDRLIADDPREIALLIHYYRLRQRQDEILERRLQARREAMRIHEGGHHRPHVPAAGVTEAPPSNNDTGLPLSPPQEQDSVARDEIPNSLALKTRRYKMKERNPNVVLDDSILLDQDDNTCTICLNELQSGDRVSDLPCGHDFHVDCLKDWLKRKNQCPLCQRHGIARHVYVPVPDSGCATEEESTAPMPTENSGEDAEGGQR